MDQIFFFSGGETFDLFFKQHLCMWVGALNKFLYISQPLHRNVGMLQQIVPQSLISTPFPVHCLLTSRRCVFLFEPLTTSLERPQINKQKFVNMLRIGFTGIQFISTFHSYSR
jgi:hypothetical protein